MELQQLKFPDDNTTNPFTGNRRFPLDEPGPASSAANSNWMGLSKVWGNIQSQSNTNATESILQNAASTTTSTLGKLGSSMLYGIAGSAISAIPDLISTGLNYDIANRTLDMQKELGNRALDLETNKFNREWDAATSAGLLSPSQFVNLPSGANYYRANGSSATLNRRQYGKPGTSYT